MKRVFLPSLLLLSTVLFCTRPGAAQGPPLPGSGGAPLVDAMTRPSVPTPGAAAPVPGPSAQQVLGGGSGANYRRLPLNYQNAAIRLEELRNIMITAKPKDFQDTISDYLDWLADMCDAHWKIYQAFAKVDSMKAQAETEKQTTLKLGSLKRQALLLKAEFLIRNNRQPEALQPLVDIVVAEPKTATGEAAYSMLKQIGFSEEAALNPGPAGALPAPSRSIAAVGSAK
ncbi:MAG: hypothetical protein K2X27_10485 [Candidatus Obscuribacterales bacterium]|nr:hypothetical protein [Candidatus Obscuribacterales bacterium]